MSREMQDYFWCIGIVVFCVFSIGYYIWWFSKHWGDPQHKSTNIKFVICMIAGIYLLGVSSYRLYLDTSELIKYGHILKKDFSPKAKENL